MKNGILVLNVIHGKEMEIEYKKNEIMDKINVFFGYECINNVKLKIIQEKVKEIKTLPQIKDVNRIEEKMSKVDSKQLKSSLKNFLKAYNERNK